MKLTFRQYGIALMQQKRLTVLRQFMKLGFINPEQFELQDQNTMMISRSAILSNQNNSRSPFPPANTGKVVPLMAAKSPVDNPNITANFTLVIIVFWLCLSTILYVRYFTLHDKK